MKIVRNSILIMIVLMMILGILSPIFAQSPNFDKEYDKWKGVCSTTEGKSKNKATCDAFESYLKDRSNDLSSQKKKLEADREAIKKDITGNLNKIEGYEKEISGYEEEIKVLENQIRVTELQIDKLEREIEERIKNIEALEEEIKQYMINAQSSMRVNGFIEFMMGAKDFSDIVRRVEGLNAIKRYNQSLIDQLNEEKEKLDLDRKELAKKKEKIQEDKLVIEDKKKEAETFKEQIQFVYDELVRQKVNMDLSYEAVGKQIEVDEALANKIKNVPANTGHGGIVGGGGSSGAGPGSSAGSGWRKTATVWSYPWGGTHLGTDYAAASGTPLLAPANGMVVYTAGGCASSGSWGCNGGFGNFVVMVYSVNGRAYGTLMAHMLNGSIAVSPKQLVSSGQVLGKMGNSGSSTGTHVHIEMFDLGPGDLDHAVAVFNQTRLPQFGLGGSSGGGSSRCDIKGSTPCRLNPEPFFGH